MSNIPTTITIDGKEYELVPKSEGKRDWGILSLKDSVDGRVYPFTIMPDNRFSINSVRRLSDGEVFTVGDKIGWGEIGNYETTLLSFRIINGRLEFEYPAAKNYITFCDFEQAIRLHKKAPSPSVEREPLFITEDGVGLFNPEDTVYSVIPKGDWNLYTQPLRDTQTKGSNLKHFSTPAARQDYVIINKPCLSLNDVERCISYGQVRSLTLGEIGRLKQLVQDRIK